jgi:glycosyltransferase involved in cell wall biosynthesis
MTLHTVPKSPTSAQRMILQSLVEEADKTVVLSHSALQQLNDRYEVNDEKVLMVPHGARPNLGARSPNPGSRPLVLTWGFIGPGKGLETAIEALAGLKDLRPVPRYVILGVTHPKVRAAEGDAYLQGLTARVRALGLAHVVEFDNRYATLDSQTKAIRRADIVLIPYDSTDQVTSGVLVEAIAACKPVIATAFPHAVEMLGTGAGTVVPHSDPDALGQALRDLLSNPSRAAQMTKVSRSIATTLYWPTIASTYEAILATLVPEHLTTVDLTESGRRRAPVDALVRTG